MLTILGLKKKKKDHKEKSNEDGMQGREMSVNWGRIENRKYVSTQGCKHPLELSLKMEEP